MCKVIGEGIPKMVWSNIDEGSVIIRLLRAQK